MFIILKNYFILYYLIVVKLIFVNCSETATAVVINNSENDLNNESIRLQVAALKDQATNLVNQINLMIGSHMNLLPTSTTPYFTTEPSVTFLVRPHITDMANSGNSESMGATPASSADSDLPTPTNFAASKNSNSQTNSHPPSSTSSSTPTPTTAQSIDSSTLSPTSAVLSTIDLFPLSLPTSGPRHYSIGQDRGNNTIKSETLVVKSLSLASGNSIRMKLSNLYLLIAIMVPIILI